MIILQLLAFQACFNSAWTIFFLWFPSAWNCKMIVFYSKIMTKAANIPFLGIKSYKSPSRSFMDLMSGVSLRQFFEECVSNYYFMNSRTLAKPFKRVALIWEWGRLMATKSISFEIDPCFASFRGVSISCRVARRSPFQILQKGGPRNRGERGVLIFRNDLWLNPLESKWCELNFYSMIIYFFKNQSHLYSRISGRKMKLLQQSVL